MPIGQGLDCIRGDLGLSFQIGLFGVLKIALIGSTAKVICCRADFAAGTPKAGREGRMITLLAFAVAMFGGVLILVAFTMFVLTIFVKDGWY